MAIRRSQIQAGAATVLATASSVFAVYLDPFMQDAPQTVKATYVAIGVPVLYGLFRFTELTLRRIHYRKVLGLWHYVTISQSNIKDENYASMMIYLDNQGTLQYKVQLFPTFDDLAEGQNSRGVAESEAMEYDAVSEQIHVLYSVNLFSDGLIRRGRLSLRVEEQGNIQGRWSSVLTNGTIHTVSRGQMFAARPQDFQEKSSTWLRNKGLAA